ncbi:MAG: hypothetical protein LBD53_04680 [Tannerella sp.]|jgi:hypothetical protein|nr:hypothetical protein [Tannerella sp.]
MQYNIFDNPVFEAVRVRNKLLPFLTSTQYRVKATGVKVKKVSVYFDKNSLSGLIKVLDNKSFNDAAAIKISAANSNCYFDAVSTADHSFVAVQLYEYSPFTYHPVKDLYIFEGAVAESFLAFLERCR